MMVMYAFGMFFIDGRYGSYLSINRSVRTQGFIKNNVLLYHNELDNDMITFDVV